MINKYSTLIIASLLLASGVLLGAFGAHGLKAASTQVLGWWQTATLYLLIHALGLLLVGILQHLRLCSYFPAACLGFGVLIFSGSLYAMALQAPRWFGAVTPIGGVLMVVGWLVLAWQLYQNQQKNSADLNQTGI